MTAAEFLIDYVRKWGWLSVANIFHDNGATTQPFTTGGFICASPSKEMLFSINTIDLSNTSVLETNYLVAPRNTTGYQQTVSCFEFDSIQRFDVLLYGQMQLFEPADITTEFPLPTRLTVDEILALDPEPQDGNLIQVQMNYKKNAMVDMFPDKNRPAAEVSGIRIKQQQEFYKKQKLFAQAMNSYLEVSDCM